MEGNCSRTDLPDCYWVNLLRYGLGHRPRSVQSATIPLHHSLRAGKRFAGRDVCHQSCCGQHFHDRLQPRHGRWRGNWLARVHAYAPDRCRCAEPYTDERPDLGLGHVPLILGGVYLAGPSPTLSVPLFMVVVTAFSFVFARLRLETGSVWPACALHAARNSVILVAFDPASAGAGATLWVGESGILVALTMIAAAVIFVRGRWTIRGSPELVRR